MKFNKKRIKTIYSLKDFHKLKCLNNTCTNIMIFKIDLKM